MKKRKPKKSTSVHYIGSGHFKLDGLNIWRTDKPREK